MGRIDAYDWDHENLPPPGTYSLTPDKCYVKIMLPEPDGLIIIPTHHENTTQAKWTLTENEDGTITLDPSIWVNKPEGWHGWLTNGELVTA